MRLLLQFWYSPNWPSTAASWGHALASGTQERRWRFFPSPRKRAPAGWIAKKDFSVAGDGYGRGHTMWTGKQWWRVWICRPPMPGMLRLVSSFLVVFEERLDWLIDKAEHRFHDVILQDAAILLEMVRKGFLHVTISSAEFFVVGTCI